MYYIFYNYLYLFSIIIINKNIQNILLILILLFIRYILKQTMFYTYFYKFIFILF